MKSKSLFCAVIFACCSFVLLMPSANATSNYTYKAGEYVTIVDGRSPNGQYSVAAHGDGVDGYEHFHIYLMDAKTGKKIGPLEEIKNNLDTGADAFYAQWSPDSRQVSITWRIDRREALVVRYRIEAGRAYRVSGPTKADGLPKH